MIAYIFTTQSRKRIITINYFQAHQCENDHDHGDFVYNETDIVIVDQWWGSYLIIPNSWYHNNNNCYYYHVDDATGSIPTSLSSLSLLTYLGLHTNQLTGEIT